MRLGGFRYSEITQISGGELVDPSVNLDVIAPSPRLGDRLRPDEVPDLLPHVFLHQERNRFLLSQRINLERPSEIRERRQPAKERDVCFLRWCLGCFDASGGTTAIGVSDDGHWREKSDQSPSEFDKLV